MGREIKRVPLDFKWPMDKTWEGFLNPDPPLKCPRCKGSGSSQEYIRLTNEWYWGNPEGYWDPDTKDDTATQHQLTQEEVNLLVDNHRLWDFAATWTGKRWEPILNDDGSQYYPTAEEVNEASRTSPMVHDSLNQWIVCKHRAEKAGFPLQCDVCEDGTGQQFRDEAHQTHCEEWKETQPPEGDGWQVWETVSEGSPVTPVFATADELIEYLVEGGDYSEHQKPPEEREPPSREAVEKFVKGSGWVPSGAKVNGKWLKNIEVAKTQVPLEEPMDEMDLVREAAENGKPFTQEGSDA